MSQWWSILPRHIAMAEQYADRVRQRRGKPNANPWTGDGREDVYGKLGEMVYGAEVGQAPHWIVDPAGDGGEDFPGGVAIKTSRTPLRATVFANCRQHEHYGDVVKFYAFVLLDTGLWAGQVLGWVPRGEVGRCPRRNPKGLATTEAFAVPVATLLPLPIIT